MATVVLLLLTNPVISREWGVYSIDETIIEQRYFLFKSFLDVFQPINTILLDSQPLSLITVVLVLELRV